MSIFLRAILMLLLVNFLAYPSFAKEQEVRLKVTQVIFRGLHRSSQLWIRSFLPIQLPSQVTRSQVTKWESKLKTTGVFQYVSARLQPGRAGEYILVFDCAEKQTTIPVIRGQFGGGTPLRVFGMYDTHTLGRLLTLGAEMRKYGEDAPGGVFFLKAPRWQTGEYALGFEAWKDNRRRGVFSPNDLMIGYIQSRQSKYRIHAFGPLMSEFASLQWGLDLRYHRLEPWTYHALAPKPAHLQMKPSSLHASSQISILPTLIYDDIQIDQLNLDGLRFITRVGLSRASQKTAGGFEHELFAYKLLGHDFNLAWHHFIGWQGKNELLDQYYLGGFDSIRGIPDGAIYGPKAFYANTELRYVAKRWKYLWLQGVGFVDGGGASEKMDQILEKSRSSLGFGVRFSVPQVYRMVFRLDYAFSLDRPGTQGISAGMNQLFQPYRPL